jgi:hypothetical protein
MKAMGKVPARTERGAMARVLSATGKEVSYFGPSTSSLSERDQAKHDLELSR